MCYQYTYLNSCRHVLDTEWVACMAWATELEAMHEKKSADGIPKCRRTYQITDFASYPEKCWRCRVLHVRRVRGRLTSNSDSSFDSYESQWDSETSATGSVDYTPEKTDERIRYYYGRGMYEEDEDFYGDDEKEENDGGNFDDSQASGIYNSGGSGLSIVEEPSRKALDGQEQRDCKGSAESTKESEGSRENMDDSGQNIKDERSEELTHQGSDESEKSGSNEDDGPDKSGGRDGSQQNETDSNADDIDETSTDDSTESEGSDVYQSFGEDSNADMFGVEEDEQYYSYDED